MASPDLAFSTTYAEARARFLGAAAAAGLRVHSEPHPLPGAGGEALALDVVRDGPADAARVLMVSSGCHGVEGYCGSGVQVAMLGDAAWRAEATRAGVAVLYLHALNPWGFSHQRRVTHENVDLNRNFHDFTRPLPANPGYAALHDALLPAVWPPPAESEARLQAYAQAHGPAALQTAISGGQYTHPDGLFYGGPGPTWSHLALRRVLRAELGACRRLGWIDLHTGLGPFGHGERIFAGRHDAKALARARAWWGPQVTSVDDGSSSSAPLEGLMWQSAGWEAPQAEATGIALEYGTLPLDRMILALRADHWVAARGGTAAQREAARQGMLEAFYPATAPWKQAVLDQAFEAARQGLAGLAGSD